MRSVYVVSSECGKIKIGIAANPWSRLISLQIGSPVALELAYAGECNSIGAAELIEKKAHEILYRNRMRGEWFNVSVQKGIDAVISAAAHFCYSIGAMDLTAEIEPENLVERREVRRGFPLKVRVSDEMLVLVDDWRALQEDIPNRPEAVRRLIEIGCQKTITPEAIRRLVEWGRRPFSKTLQ